MTLALELSPVDEARLAIAARERGMDPTECARELLREQLPPLAPGEATRALFAAWEAEDATDDPDEIRKAEEELQALKDALNANRASVGARLLFP